MQTVKQPQFIILTDLAENIYKEGSYGAERKKAVAQLETWHREYRTKIFSNSEAKQMSALMEVFELAIKIAECAFVPPYERQW